MIAPIDVTNIRIETDRLILRPWRESDLADFYEYARVDGVGQMAGWQPHKSLEESKTILEMFIRDKKTLALELKETGKVIGSLGLEEPEELDLPEDSQGREIGYVLSRDYWGRGLMPEAVRAVVQHCFAELDYDWLSCGHFESNAQSRRVIEKCGFTHVKDILFTTRMGTQEPAKLYIRYNTYKKVRHMTAPIDVTGIHLETPRLLLRPLEPGDLEGYHAIVSDPDVIYLGGGEVSPSLEESKKRLEEAREKKEDLAMVLKETGKMVGTFSLQSRNWTNYPIDRALKGREFGYDLNKAYWGRGLMPEALAAMTDYCLQTLGYDFVTCGHFLRNSRSARVIEKCGYQFLFEGPHTMPDGHSEDIRTYIRYNQEK